MSVADKSHGYEEIAWMFIAGRGQNHTGVGAGVVAEWSRLLPERATVLDLGCGPGVPISETLIHRGFRLYGVDASPSMVAAFQSRFPSNPIQCSPAEDSDFFGLKFDAIISWGLFFLLESEVQHAIIRKVSQSLVDGGRFLFTAPHQICSWSDAMTEQTSYGLGYDTYRSALEANGLTLVDTYSDEGENYYYSALKNASSGVDFTAAQSTLT
jgi:SAM-dependent methyltransferase